MVAISEYTNALEMPLIFTFQVCRPIWFKRLQTLRYMPMNVSYSGAFSKANICLSLIENELNSLLDASHLVDYVFDLILEDIC